MGYAQSNRNPSTHNEPAGGAPQSLGAYLYHQPSLTKQIGSKLYSVSQQQQQDSTAKSAGGHSSLKKVIPHPLLRASVDNSGTTALPPCLNSATSN